MAFSTHTFKVATWVMDMVITKLAHVCGVVPGYFFGSAVDDYLDWAKAQSPDHILAHSSISEPLAPPAVNAAYGSPAFRKLLTEDNQWGLPSLKTAIAERYGIEETKESPRVLLTPGASTAIYVILRTFIKPGDEVILETPFYQPTALVAKSMGAKIVLWQRVGDSFTLDLGTLPTLISPRTKLIILSNPHNPTSALVPIHILSAISEVSATATYPGQIKIVVDEIFLDLLRNLDSAPNTTTFPGDTSLSAASLGDEFISINSLSKIYGLSRLRCGWVLAATPVIRQLRETYKLVVNIGALDTEAVASVIFGNLDDFLLSSQNIVATNRAILQEELHDLMARNALQGAIPQHGCVFFPKIAAAGRFHSAQNFAYHDHIRIGLGGPVETFHRAIANLRVELEKIS